MDRASEFSLADDVDAMRSNADTALIGSRGAVPDCADLRR